MGSNAKLFGKIPELKGKSNYHEWSTDVTMILEANDLEGALTEQSHEKSKLSEQTSS